MTAIRTALILILPALLAGCFFVPGNFEAEMRIAPDGAFDFAYAGEIRLGDEEGLSAQPMGPRTRMAPDGSKQASGEDPMQQQMAELFRFFMGGLDADDEAQIAGLAEQLEERVGWNSVEYLGEGWFAVDYALSGTLDRDFAFPVFPDFVFNLPFMAASPRDDGTVRVVSNVLMRPPENADDDEEEYDASFTLRTTAQVVGTNGEILDGEVPGETVIRWSTDPLSEERPEAILRLRGS